MVDFRTALVKAIRRHGVAALAIAAAVALLFWVLNQWLGDRVVNFLNSNAALLWKWIEANPIGATALAGIAFVAFCAAAATRDEWIRKFAEFMREPDIPALEIRWNPGEQTYRFEYPIPPDRVLNVHFRICVVNISKRTTLTDIRVVLDKLTPHELSCVPCSLRLMNNILPGDTPIERFSLNPGDKQFIDLMLQKPGMPEFWILHTVQRIAVQIPAQAYALTILVTAANAPSVSRQFELVKDGPIWNMRPTGA